MVTEGFEPPEGKFYEPYAVKFIAKDVFILNKDNNDSLSIKPPFVQKPFENSISNNLPSQLPPIQTQFLEQPPPFISQTPNISKFVE